jgi:hypothetical protein
MEEDQVAGSAADAPSLRVGTFVLRLRLGQGEPLTGSITPAGATQGIEFHGWIDFMVAINLLRAELEDPSREDTPPL